MTSKGTRAREAVAWSRGGASRSAPAASAASSQGGQCRYTRQVRRTSSLFRAALVAMSWQELAIRFISLRRSIAPGAGREEALASPIGRSAHSAREIVVGTSLETVSLRPYQNGRLRVARGSELAWLLVSHSCSTRRPAGPVGHPPCVARSTGRPQPSTRFPCRPRGRGRPQAGAPVKRRRRRSSGRSRTRNACRSYSFSNHRSLYRRSNRQ